MPFLDHEVVELAGRAPPALKLANNGKGVLKAASRGIVPDEVIDRSKGYFPVPAIRQLEGPYLDLARQALLDPAAGGVCDFRRRVEAMLAKPNEGRTTLGSTPCGSWRCSNCGCRPTRSHQPGTAHERAQHMSRPSPRGRVG